jgi:hypothetical protein
MGGTDHGTRLAKASATTRVTEDVPQEERLSLFDRGRRPGI